MSHQKLTPEEIAEKKQKVLEVLENPECAGEATACRKAHLKYTTHMKWRSEDSEYAAAITELERLRGETIEMLFRAVMLAALKGEDIAKSQEIILKAPTSTIFTLKGIFPEKYADKQVLSGPRGGQVQLSLSWGPDEQKKE